MTLTLMHDCPHCGTKDVGFEFRSEYEISRNSDGTPWMVTCSCGRCEKALIFEVVATVQGSPKTGLRDSPSYFKIVATFPEPPTLDAPSHLPENILRFYQQATESLSNSHFDAAGAMYRKALETAFKNKFPAYKGSQYDRINKAVTEGELTKDLGDWAHQIRIDGNNAVHEDEPFTKEQTDGLHSFSEVVLMYLYTLPEMLRLRRGKVEE